MLKRLLGRAKISKIGVRPAAPLPGRRGVTIVTILRNEESHVGEWAAFHWAAGVRHFHIYDDGSTDKSVAILRSVLPAEALTVIPWAQRLSDIRLSREIHNQVLAYAHAAANFGSAYRWMAFVDVDEFLVPVGNASLEAALAPLSAFPNISLPWHMFGTCGHDVPPEGGVVENYLRRVRDPMSDAPGVRAFKMIVDPCRLSAVRVHSMETDGTQDTWNDRGLKASFATRERPDFYSAEAIQLNHYYTRSRLDLEIKIARGPNLRAKNDDYRRKVMRTVKSIEQDTVEDLRALEFWQAKRGSFAPHLLDPIHRQNEVAKVTQEAALVTAG